MEVWSCIWFAAVQSYDGAMANDDPFWFCWSILDELFYRLRSQHRQQHWSAPFVPQFDDPVEKAGYIDFKDYKVILFYTNDLASKEPILHGSDKRAWIAGRFRVWSQGGLCQSEGGLHYKYQTPTKRNHYITYSLFGLGPTCRTPRRPVPVVSAGQPEIFPPLLAHQGTARRITKILVLRSNENDESCTHHCD